MALLEKRWGDKMPSILNKIRTKVPLLKGDLGG